MEQMVGSSRCAELTIRAGRALQRGGPISMCVGLGEWSLRARARCRKKSSRKNEKIVLIRTNCFCSNTNRFTQSDGRQINPVCAPQDPDRLEMANLVPRICPIHSSPLIAAVRRHIMGQAN